MWQDGIQKWSNFNTFFPNLTSKNRYITSKNGSIGRLFVTPPLSEIAKKLGKMLKYTSHFQSAFGTAAYNYYLTYNRFWYLQGNFFTSALATTFVKVWKFIVVDCTINVKKHVNYCFNQVVGA